MKNQRKKSPKYKSPFYIRKLFPSNSMITYIPELNMCFYSDHSNIYIYVENMKG